MTLKQDNDKDLADLKRQLGLAASATTSDVVDKACADVRKIEKRVKRLLQPFTLRP